MRLPKHVAEEMQAKIKQLESQLSMAPPQDLVARMEVENQKLRAKLGSTMQQLQVSAESNRFKETQVSEFMRLRADDLLTQQSEVMPSKLSGRHSSRHDRSQLASGAHAISLDETGIRSPQRGGSSATVNMVTPSTLQVPGTRSTNYNPPLSSMQSLGGSPLQGDPPGVRSSSELGSCLHLGSGAATSTGGVNLLRPDGTPASYSKPPASSALGSSLGQSYLQPKLQSTQMLEEEQASEIRRLKEEARQARQKREAASGIMR
eukprot:TRINITY_DN28997_c0_g1_i1.p1 TRINITY_DN28997_c0_g1~~TRINITY_DN28997_c0_g1_i1.p1  ORF type:complete len:262 (+),score=48.41 TRINITY_DN28997_c0_g1_i1:3-788(+)